MDFVVRLIGVGRKDVASEISKLINQVLTSAVDPIAKAEGFRKSGRTYRRMRFGRVEVMAVEARSWNTAARGQFDVMVGIVDPKIAATLKGESVDLTKARGGEGGCARVLGHLLAPPQNRQWAVGLDQDWSSEAQSLREAILKAALPWFEKSHAPGGLLNLLQDDPSMAAREALAICFASVGDMDRAQNEIAEILRRRPDLQWHTEALMSRVVG